MLKKSNNKGITLISLVITIIILLILSGISLGMISGQNSIIEQAGDAKIQTDTAQEKEQLEKATVNSMSKSKYGNVEKDYLYLELNNYSEITGKEEVENGFKISFKSGRVYLVDVNGNIELQN